MIEVQAFLLVFGAVLTLIGVIVFFLLAWFKETTGQQNVVKILQAEFRLSNPGLVIFVGGLGLMVAPIFPGASAIRRRPAATHSNGGCPSYTYACAQSDRLCP
jgi:formate hydrogenlyase subunit 3/multisubunit Na+/H+ antiporter MnhD subunit